jgi:excinuclease ABC subunit C
MATATESTREERIEEQLKGLPAKPGVYLFRDGKGTVLYVGKAKSLRSRVRSYFRGGDSRLGLDRLVERVEQIEVIVTSTEVEAFHLEQNLIKRYRPTFNVRLRDDKSYPYIAVTVEDEYPRVMFTRERHRRGVVYFGPYASAKKVRETLDVLNRVFPYRPCEGPQPGRHSGIPCLDYHIDRCLAPCVGYVTKEDYREIVERVIEFLSGETRPVLRELEEKMHAAAERQEFEEAARYRNRLTAVRHLAERQAADKRAIGTVDVVGIAATGRTAAVQVFPLRGGRLVDRHTFYLENEAGEDVPQLLESFCLEYYGGAPSVPPLLVVPPDVGPTEALAGYLSDLRGSKVEVRPARRGEKRRLQELAQQNAELALESDAADRERKRLRRIEALEELRECLNLESLPIRIECFDISNIQRDSPVGSMVVFQDAVPKKAHYRKFGIKRVEGQDDFAMMAEVISRRFARAREVTEERYDEGFAAIPNLVVVDGGKGQLSAALAAVQAYDLPRLAVIALAKREEEVFVPGRSDPIVLRADSAGLQLLQRIRDEAHRFALGFHRHRRDAKARESILDALPGVGPARKRALIQHFGSPERLLAASSDELEGVPGVPAKVGREIYTALHRAGRA